MAKRLIQGVNDLASQDTPILDQWDYEKNAPLTPDQVSYSSTKKVWWRCERGHCWDDSVESRFYSAGQCPICNRQRIISGINDFASEYPELLSSWDYTKNTVAPSKISSGYSHSLYWVCEKNHSWKTSIHNRLKQTECPFCSGRKILPGFNDFATKFPEMLKEWDYALNDADPTRIAPFVQKKYHWICPKGHRYEAAIASRTRLNTSCPYCAGQRVLKGFNDLASQNPELLSEWDYEKNGIRPRVCF